MKKSVRMIINILAVVILVIIDQLTKKWAVITLKDKEPIPIIKNIVEFHYLPNGNSGAAFGMFAGKQVMFLIIASLVIIVMLFLLYALPFNKKYRILHILLVFIMAGGAGNMIDRLFYVNVIDFIYIVAINFPIFNVADMYVSVSTVLIAILLIFKYREEDFTEMESAIKAVFKKKEV